MIVAPRIRGFICTTAHPTGCARFVHDQIAWTKAHVTPRAGGTPGNVLVIGGSAGYGLASRIVAGFGWRARTLCVSFEKAPDAAGTTTATAGWYNNRAYDAAAEAEGLYARSIHADAFADATKTEVADLIQRDLGRLDLLVYSLAAPARRDPKSGVLFRSTIKPVGNPVRIKTLNVAKAVVQDLELTPASAEEIQATVKVMGGEDWERWISHLKNRDLLNPGFRTIAYTYIGSALTWPIYWEGTLGKAKEHLDQSATHLRQQLGDLRGDARVTALKATVTQASSAIPAIPLYASLLFRVMKDRQMHENSLEHIARLFQTHIADGARPEADAGGRWRVDDWELRDDIQAEVRRRWDLADSSNILELSDLDGYRRDFLRIFGFEVDGVDYAADVRVTD